MTTEMSKRQLDEIGERILNGRAATWLEVVCFTVFTLEVDRTFARYLAHELPAIISILRPVLTAPDQAGTLESLKYLAEMADGMAQIDGKDEAAIEALQAGPTTSFEATLKYPHGRGGMLDVDAGLQRLSTAIAVSEIQDMIVKTIRAYLDSQDAEV